MAMGEKRREERNVYESQESVYVELKVESEPNTYQTYDLKVNDCSRYGLGMLITQEDFDVLRSIREGDTLRNMVFFFHLERNQCEWYCSAQN